MADIARMRCFHHDDREAVARCLSCGRFYCRECVTEHEGRLACSSCLRRLAVERRPASSLGARLAAVALCACGVFTAWLFFFALGRALLKLPSSFHEGTVWSGSAGTEE